MKHLNYLVHLLRHKYLFVLEGRKLNLSWWTCLVHDLTKFRPSEWFPHVNAFATKQVGQKYSNTYEFRMASVWHRHRNWHHWDWWVALTDEGRVIVLEMTDQARREMLADWRSSARGSGGDVVVWYQNHQKQLILGSNTRDWIETQLGLESRGNE